MSGLQSFATANELDGSAAAASELPPRVSIGLPIFNGEKYVGDAIDSILAQTFEDFELIISDNASTDRTREICSEYALRDTRIRYCPNEKNIGLAPNFNRLVDLARGEYFQWLAHDDLVEPQYLERCVQILDEHTDVFVAYARSKNIDQFGKPQEIPEVRFLSESNDAPERWREALKTIWTTHGLLNLQYGLMRLPVLKKTNLLGDYRSSDSIFLAELALTGRFKEVPDRLFIRRVHPDRATEQEKRPDGKPVTYGVGKKNALSMPYWRYLSEYFRVLRKSDLPAGDKLSCVAPILRYYVGSKYRSILADVPRALARMI